eukprot:997534-Rhodomonas_salina.4
MSVTHCPAVKHCSPNPCLLICTCPKVRQPIHPVRADNGEQRHLIEIEDPDVIERREEARVVHEIVCGALCAGQASKDHQLPAAAFTRVDDGHRCVAARQRARRGHRANRAQPRHAQRRSLENACQATASQHRVQRTAPPSHAAPRRASQTCQHVVEQSAWFRASRMVVRERLSGLAAEDQYSGPRVECPDRGPGKEHPARTTNSQVNVANERNFWKGQTGAHSHLRRRGQPLRTAPACTPTDPVNKCKFSQPAWLLDPASARHVLIFVAGDVLELAVTTNTVLRAVDLRVQVERVHTSLAVQQTRLLELRKKESLRPSRTRRGAANHTSVAPGQLFPGHRLESKQRRAGEGAVVDVGVGGVGALSVLVKGLDCLSVQLLTATNASTLDLHVVVVLGVRDGDLQRKQYLRSFPGDRLCRVERSRRRSDDIIVNHRAVAVAASGHCRHQPLELYNAPLVANEVGDLCKDNSPNNPPAVLAGHGCREGVIQGVHPHVAQQFACATDPAVHDGCILASHQLASRHGVHEARRGFASHGRWEREHAAPGLRIDLSRARCIVGWWQVLRLDPRAGRHPLLDLPHAMSELLAEKRHACWHGVTASRTCVHHGSGVGTQLQYGSVVAAEPLLHSGCAEMHSGFCNLGRMRIHLPPPAPVTDKTLCGNTPFPTRGGVQHLVMLVPTTHDSGTSTRKSLVGALRG